MRHIEENECGGISHTRLLQEQTKKIIIKDALKAGEGAPKALIPHASDFDDIEGGVEINMRQPTNPAAITHQPLAVKDDASSMHWLKLGDESSSGNSAAERDLLVFSTVSQSPGECNNRDSTVKQTESPDFFAPDTGDISVAHTSTAPMQPQNGPDPQNSTAFGLDLDDPSFTLRLLHENWDPTRFVNSFSGAYICPCGAGFQDLKKFEYHVLNESQKQRIMQ